MLADLLSSQELCSLICTSNSVLWIPEDVRLRIHFDSFLLWGNQDSGGYTATDCDCVCSSFQCH